MISSQTFSKFLMKIGSYLQKEQLVSVGQMACQLIISHGQTGQGEDGQQSGEGKYDVGVGFSGLGPIYIYKTAYLYVRNVFM